jgi:hypothetical protein
MNKALVQRKFPIPKEVMDDLHSAFRKYPHHQGEGLKRCERLLKDKELTYQKIKRLIHDMKYMDQDKDPISYELNGGKMMYDWAKRALDDARKEVDGQKNSRKRANDISGLGGIRKNAYLSNHGKDGKSVVDSILTGNQSGGGLTPMISEQISRIQSLIKKTNK